MSESQTWDVPCYVCGHKLGSNKATCGQAQAGKKAVKFPPCQWAHTDEKYVRKAMAAAAVAEEQKRKEQEDAQETMARYHAGKIDFAEIPEGMPMPKGTLLNSTRKPPAVIRRRLAIAD